MAQKIFKGFKQELEGQFTAQTGYLYFVRKESNTGKTDGYLLFNGKMYGTANEAKAELEALIGELPSGFTSISDWITSNELVTAEALTNLDERVSANTEAIAAISGIAGDFATKTELGQLSGRVDTLSAISAETRIATLEASAATKTEVGTLSGRVDTIEADYLKGADKTELEGEIGTVSGRVDTLSAVSAETRITALEAISADTRLNALEDGVQLVASGDSSVSVSAISNGVQTVSVNISSAADNAIELDATNGGLFAAIYYDGDDSDNE